MKKINVVFALECVIIVLLLAVLGVMLKNNTGNAAEKTVLEETVAEEAAESQNTNEEEMSVPGIVNVTDVVMNSDEVAAEEPVASSDAETIESISSDSVSENPEEPVASDKFMSGKKIVVFADSIWNEGRGVDGVAEHIQEQTGATVYNCAVGGSTAAVVNESSSVKDWTSSSFNGMIYVAKGLVSADRVVPNDEAYEVIKQVNLEEMDYAIVAYGGNDFFCGVSIYPETYCDVTNFVGALRNGIAHLQLDYPDLKIIMISPMYTTLFEGEKELEIGDYVEAARGVANEMGVYFIDMFHSLGSDAQSRVEHLRDGVHLDTEGRKTYADAVVRFLENMEQ